MTELLVCILTKWNPLLCRNKVRLLLRNVETTPTVPVLRFRRMINPSTSNTAISYGTTQNLAT